MSSSTDFPLLLWLSCVFLPSLPPGTLWKRRGSRRWERGACERRCVAAWLRARTRCKYLPPAARLIFSALSTHTELLCGGKMKRDTLGVFFLNLWSRCGAATETGNNKRPRWSSGAVTGPDLGGRSEITARRRRDHGAVIVRGAARPLTPPLNNTPPPHPTQTLSPRLTAI